MLVRDSVKEFLCDCELRQLSQKTIRNYKNHLLLIMNWLDEVNDITKLEQVTTPVLKKFIQFQQEKKLSASYINCSIKVLRAFLSMSQLRNT